MESLSKFYYGEFQKKPRISKTPDGFNGVAPPEPYGYTGNFELSEDLGAASLVWAVVDLRNRARAVGVALEFYFDFEVDGGDKPAVVFTSGIEEVRSLIEDSGVRLISFEDSKIYWERVLALRVYFDGAVEKAKEFRGEFLDSSRESDGLSAEDWAKLAELSNRARYDSTTSESSADMLMGVSLYASRMAG